MQYKFLDNINTPDDLKKLSVDELPELCNELRDFIVNALSSNPGHLGSSLGVIELTVALHYVLSTPYDRIVWDVGHQSYAHKILTTRREKFYTNRTFGGISGFPSIFESEYDAFGTGHASTSISAALGMSIAAQLKGEDKKVVAVIGDGSLTGGLAFEGLNNASTNPNDMLVILNDNNMAIDPIRGGLSSYLTKIHFLPSYNKVRYSFYKIFNKLGLFKNGKKSQTIRLANTLKGLRLNMETNIFEGLNLRYFGPVDGHDVKLLVSILSEIKNYKGPKVLHIITQKGKGYKPAEEQVTIWHAPGKYDPTTGERISQSGANEPIKFQDVFGKTLLELAKKNEKIVGITPAMVSGSSLNYMMEAFPARTFDVGIAEGHAVTFSAGLAREGMIPFCNIYSTFMQRAYDNVIHDVALQKLHVIFCLDRAGIVGNDGVTHQGQFDIAMMRVVPNLTIAVPRDEHILRNLMLTAVENPRPWVMRYPRGKGVLVDWENEMKQVQIGKGCELKRGQKIAILGVGPILYTAQKAISVLEGEDSNLNIGLYDLIFVKPLDNEMLIDVAQRYDIIFMIEDGSAKGGAGSAVEEFFDEHNIKKEVHRFGLPDKFVEHGSPAELYHALELDCEGIVKRIKAVIY